MMTDEKIFRSFCEVVEALENLADICYEHGGLPETVENLDMLARETIQALREWKKEIGK